MIRDYIKILINVSITFVINHFKFIFLSYWLFDGNMSGSAAKRKIRIENKKKKMAALLDIVKLNEYDRALKKNAIKVQEKSDRIQPGTGPSPKRLKTVEEQNNINQENGIVEDPPPLIGELCELGKPKLEGEEFIALKIMLREKTKHKKGQPQFKLRELGENASLKVNIDDRVPIFLSDLQHLLMYSQIGVHSPYLPSRWCALEKYPKLVNANLLIIENVSLYNFMANESKMPYLSSTFDHKLEMITPSSYHSDVVKDLSMVPLTGSQVKKFHTEFGTLESAVFKCNEVFDTVKNFFPIDDLKVEATTPCDKNLPPNDKFSRTQLLLSGWQMVEENFPLPIQGLMERKYSGYTLTKKRYKDVTPFSPMFAIDCEMCRTSTGELELTRISAVDENLKVFYDTLVKPDNEITDYLTKWSGINKKMMKNVTKKLKDVQCDLKKLLPEDAILVGQSLANDLHALKMMHPYIIDTSVVYNITGDRTRKSKLQVLAREFLSEKIQIGHQGHCSTEDSLACMKLVQLKLKKHLYYGDCVMNNGQNDIRNYPDMATSQYATSMLRQCVKVDKKASIVGLNEIGQKYKFYIDKGESANIENLVCQSGKTNEDVVNRYIESLEHHSLNIAHLRIEDNDLDDSNCKIFKKIDKWIQELCTKTQAPSLVVVLFSGHKQGNGVCFLKLMQVNI